LTGATLLKWVGGVTAVLSLVFAVQKFTQMITDTRERQRTTSELYRVGKMQESSADYAAAWSSFEQGLKTAEPGGQLAKLMGRLDEERRQLREAQEDLAMRWLENLRVNASKGESFTDAVAPLTPVLTRGITASSGARKADLLAHLGWANFLRWRDGQRELTPDRHYQEALVADSLNPYAHAYLAHWSLWTRGQAALPEANAHFAAALRSRRARAEVRSKQTAALINLSDAGETTLLRTVAEMVRGNELVDVSTRSRIYGIYWSSCPRPGTTIPRNAERFEAIRAALPAAEHAAMVRTLFGDGFDQWPVSERQACLAALR
jgi:hypothetical protein